MGWFPWSWTRHPFWTRTSCRSSQAFLYHVSWLQVIFCHILSFIGVATSSFAFVSRACQPGITQSRVSMGWCSHHACMVSAGLLMPPQIMPEFNVCFKDKPIQARIVEAETKEYTGCVGRSGAKPDEYIKTWHAVLSVDHAFRCSFLSHGLQTFQLSGEQETLLETWEAPGIHISSSTQRHLATGFGLYGMGYRHRYTYTSICFLIVIRAYVYIHIYMHIWI